MVVRAERHCPYPFGRSVDAVPPAATALGLIRVIASYAIVFGVILLILSLKVRKFRPKSGVRYDDVTGLF